MNFSAKVKSELITKSLKKPCCKLAALSAFIRTSGSIVTRGKKVGFVLSCDAELGEFFISVVEKLFGETPTAYSKRSERVKITFLSDDSLDILLKTKIIEISGDGLNVRLDIDDELLKNDCCADAYIIGAFLGSGSVTVPEIDGGKSTGYHLEFVFSKYVTASDFADLLSRRGFMPKTVGRKDNFVVYFKSTEEISGVIAQMGAVNSYLYLTDIQVKKEVRNEENRKLNCEMSNLTKQIDAAIRIRRDIETIEKSIGLFALPETLRSVCAARLEDESASMSELAQKLGISKSCLNHRLRKISEIANDLQ